LPDTFASAIAARKEKSADNAIGNITGSNSVNVFMGLGLPWLIVSIYKYHIVSLLFLENFLCLIINIRFFYIE
jgi:Ca2+/Na+ antiporter